MNITKTPRRKYKSSFLSSIQLVLSYSSKENEFLITADTIPELAESGFAISELNGSEQIVRANRNNTKLILSSEMMVLLVNADDYKSFENYCSLIKTIQGTLKSIHIDEITTILFQKQNRYPFAKKGMNDTPSVQDLYETVFTKEYLQEKKLYISFNGDQSAITTQNKFSENDDFYFVDSVLQAIQMTAIERQDLISVLTNFNDEIFSIWSAITSDGVKAIMDKD